MNIFCKFGSHQTVEYACEELERYLLLIDEDNVLNIDVGVYADFDMKEPDDNDDRWYIVAKAKK